MYCSACLVSDTAMYVCVLLTAVQFVSEVEKHCLMLYAVYAQIV